MMSFISTHFSWFVLTPVVVLFVGGFIDFLWYMYSCSKKWESTMKPCPKCGHKAIIVWYNGENNPQFYLPECGAYSRRKETDGIYYFGEVNPIGYFDNQPPMTDIQKECSYLAGYCNPENENIPRFHTARAAAIWWNKNCEKIKKQTGKT